MTVYACVLVIVIPHYTTLHYNTPYFIVLHYTSPPRQTHTTAPSSVDESIVQAVCEDK
jgi:hypothetical protein